MAVRQDASTGELVSDGKVQEASAAQSNDTMHCKVYSPFKVYFEGEAGSISAESATGPFDILPRHHNFITLLSPCDLVIRTGKDDIQTFQISGGIMHVKANDVIVFLDV
jgi:F0F1-type ATP synthase epsilon subunit